jgi:hypothetical protein
LSTTVLFVMRFFACERSACHADSDRVSTEQLFDVMCHTFGGLWPKPFANDQIEIQELRRFISSSL